MNSEKIDLERFLINDDFALLNDKINKLDKASFLFVTYNRCPHKDFSKNPLVWAFQTLLNNSHQLINDFVVVDDASTDYTRQTISWLKNTYKIKIKYIRNKTHKEYSFNRRKGIVYTKNNLVFMGDDDCLYSKYFIVGSLLSYKYLQSLKHAENIAILNLPVYEKQLKPTQYTSLKNIGRVYWNKTFFYHEFDKFPLEYLHNPIYLDKSNILLKPFEVQTFKGVNLCNKELIIKAGNYLDLSMWKFGYSEHIELTVRLSKHNYKMYHQPDPKVSCLHLKYGNKTRDKFSVKYKNNHLPGIMYKLGELITYSQKKTLNTGSRIDDYNFHVIEVGTFFSFYLKLSYELGIKFAYEQYQRFVVKGQVFSTTPSKIIKNQNTREKIFWEGINKGLNATELQTGKRYPELLPYLENKLQS